MKKIYLSLITLLLFTLQLNAQSYKFILNTKVSDQNGKAVANHPVVIERDNQYYKLFTDGSGIATDVQEYKVGYNPVYHVTVEGTCNASAPVKTVTAFDGTLDIDFVICSKIDTVPPCNVKFNYSGSNVGNGAYTFTAEPNIPGALYKWDFGDGTSAEGPVVNHFFVKSGSYGVTLTMVTKTCIATFQDKVEVKGTNPPPPPPPVMTCECCATMTINPQNDKLIYTFHGNANFKATEYNWNINGNEVSGQEAKWQFDSVGKYTVSMEAKGENCYVKINKTLIIVDDSTNTGGNDCKIDFTYSGVNADLGTFYFKPIIGASNNVKLSWDFGDGTTSTEFAPKHQYGKAGSYKVTLVVTFENGKVCTITKVISVKDTKTTTGPTNGGIKVGDLFPNPTTPTWVKLEIFSEKSVQVQISLLDSNQNTLKEMTVDLNPGSNEVVIDLQNYSPGFYYLLVSKDGKTIRMQKLVITK